MMMHQHDNKEVKTIQCAVLTISDTRNKETDKGGQLVQKVFERTEYRSDRRTLSYH